MRAFVGTYRNGIHVLDVDEDGGLTPRSDLADVADPSYLVLAPDGRTLYCVDEALDGAVCALRVEGEQLSVLSRVMTHGADPAHLSVHPSGRWLLVANYTGGTIASFPILDDGRLGDAAHVVEHAGSGPNPARQEGPHPHMIVTDPSGDLVFVPDLGLDRVVGYRLDVDSGQLVEQPDAGGRLPPGAGPRHMAFGDRAVYVLGELDSTVVVFSFEDGALSQTQVASTRPDDFQDRNSTAALRVDPSGRWLYASNRGHHSLAIFSIDPVSGALTFVGHTPTGGQNPRDFNIDPHGRFLFAANQDSNTIVTFRLRDDGIPEPTGHVVEVPRPVCIVFGA